ncbi:MaoC family dehydratase N-terminal domain-containing protein [Pueribacillus sp. YX66]|uniref:MaoC family dehydratase N-terminal domain-containing protein n=1 Tax=Pueribacillus sp. YX66 TaxID=3229242 RepID=UPI00358CFA7A
MFKDLIGKRSEKVLNTIERGAVRKFAHSIGDEHPIFVDEDYAKNSRYGKNIAPVTFARTLNFGTIEELKLPKQGLIHGEQSFHYERPLYVGEDVYCYTEVKDYYEKTGKSGTMSFLVTENNGEDENGNTIFKSRSVVIINEAVRKGMNA